MSRRRLWLGFAAIIAVLFAGGCSGKNTDDGHDHDAGDDPAHEGRAAPVSFKEGLGLRLAPETAGALGLQTAGVTEQRITHAIEVVANVFDAGPPARAVALVPPEIADLMEQYPPPDTKILSVRRDIVQALTQAEVVLSLPGSPEPGAMLKLTLRGPERTVVAVPRSAVLRSATGNFVYVENDGHLLRTAVTIGAGDDGFTEITAGLKAGAVVATAAVEQLWLTELRLTKGGGHSH